MKKTLIFLMIMVTSTTYAGFYGTYNDSNDDLDVSDTYIDDATPCDCICDNDTPRNNRRDTYTGVRIYKNEHGSYSYHPHDGHTFSYIDDNFGFGTVMGNRLTDWARVEYETLYMGSEFNKLDTDFEYDIWGNFLNAYLFHEFDGAISPYVGLGIGLTGIWGDVNGELDNAFDLSYQAMVGILFELNSRIELDLGFKYVNFGRVAHDYGSSRIDATQIYLGASYKFGI